MDFKAERRARIFLGFWESGKHHEIGIHSLLFSEEMGLPSSDSWISSLRDRVPFKKEQTSESFHPRTFNQGSILSSLSPEDQQWIPFSLSNVDSSSLHNKPNSLPAILLLLLLLVGVLFFSFRSWSPEDEISSRGP
ncbi:hypothetical protein CEXT_253021 [Caerostris extrusa]|uniref:Uncharacterized protein n=1 Tax=Caerostris extrusa TaxID=172846 RepID=A0AAV4S4E8_CAEEX|nr:hypothetical protein CEXT_253021 [Caerostris extrusa]